MNGQKYYQPYTLPKLPRRACPFQNLHFTGRNGEIPKLKPCPNRAGANGWCTEHGYCDELLKLVYSVGCPELEVNSSLIVFAGLASWEDYAIYHPISRHKPLIAKLMRLRQEQLAEKGENRATRPSDGQGIA